MARSAVAVTVREALASASARLREAGCDTPRLDAELLLAHVLGVERARLVLEPSERAPDEFDALVERRAAREPVAYILGYKGFRRLTLRVDRRVLIPRPETELLVEVGLELAPGESVADVGTGSGAVALALKDERGDLRVTGIDSSPGALAVARENGARLGIDVRFAEADLLDDRTGYDAVLANLPYVADGDPLPPEIARHEPTHALRAGSDGLDVIRRLVDAAERIPFVALEVGAGQADAVAGLLNDAGFDQTDRRRDLAVHERVVIGTR